MYGVVWKSFLEIPFDDYKIWWIFSHFWLSSTLFGLWDCTVSWGQSCLCPKITCLEHAQLILTFSSVFFTGYSACDDHSGGVWLHGTGWYQTQCCTRGHTYSICRSRCGVYCSHVHGKLCLRFKTITQGQMQFTRLTVWWKYSSHKVTSKLRNCCFACDVMAAI